MRVVNLEEKAQLIKERHKYKLIAELNNYQFKLIKAKREFVWHSHEETDEMFFVVEGQWNHLSLAEARNTPRKVIRVGAAARENSSKQRL